MKTNFLVKVPQEMFIWDSKHKIFKKSMQSKLLISVKLPIQSLNIFYPVKLLLLKILQKKIANTLLNWKTYFSIKNIVT